jgi:hypothetical protein
MLQGIILLVIIRNIGQIFVSLRDRNQRPPCFGPPSDEIMFGPHLNQLNEQQ